MDTEFHDEAGNLLLQVDHRMTFLSRSVSSPKQITSQCIPIGPSKYVSISRLSIEVSDPGMRNGSAGEQGIGKIRKERNSIMCPIIACHFKSRRHGVDTILHNRV